MSGSNVKKQQDHNLASAAQAQQQINLLWALGDWQSLANLTSLTPGSQLSELANGYIAVAALQLGDIDAAKESQSQLIKHTQNPAQCSALMIASVYTCLSNAHFICNEKEKAQQLMQTALQLTEPKATQQLIHELRTEKQQKKLLSMYDSITTNNPLKKFTVKKIMEIDLGLAWAGNSVNTVIFRHHGIFTHDDIQYTAFYVDSKTLRVIQRNLTTAEISNYDILGQYNIKDAHNSISLGIDKEKHLHISYDHHSTQLKYRRSLRPQCINGWTDEMPMTGQREAKVTYPTFLLPTDHSPLQLLYRDGIHDKGSAYLKYYNESEQCWIDSNTAILSGAENQPWTSNAYWNHPVRDKNGVLHISFVWRTHTIGNQQQINNMNVCYAKSFDNGKNWYSTNMKPFQLPITQVNAEVAWAIAPASNMINQTSMAIDSLDQPHIVFYSNDSAGIVQYQHLWFNGNQWCHQIISQRSTAFELQGGGTLRIPISRPEIVIDENDNVFVIYRGDITDNCMAALCLNAPNYHYDPNNQQIIHDEPLGLAEPIIDHSRWQKDHILSILLQFNDQPNHDIGHTSIDKKIFILDVTLNT